MAHTLIGSGGALHLLNAKKCEADSKSKENYYCYDNIKAVHIGT